MTSLFLALRIDGLIFHKIKVSVGARERTRTSTSLRTLAPQASLSTGFSTRAIMIQA